MKGNPAFPKKKSTLKQFQDSNSVHLEFIHRSFLLQSETGELSGLVQHPLLF